MNFDNEKDSFPYQIPTIVGLNSGDVDAIKDFAFSSDGLPGYTSPLVNMMRGFKILGQGPQMAPVSDDTIGLSFISRPIINLSDDNCSRHPQLANLYKPAKNSPQMYIKCLLDKVEGDRNSCELLDNKMGWMVLLTNLLKRSDGFGDLDLETTTTDGGFRGEVHQQINGILDENGQYSLRQTYFNVKSGIIKDIFSAWLRYIYEVKVGDNGIEPYPEADYQNYTDFDCRVYHIFMNKNLRTISNMYMTVQSIPTTLATGAIAAIDNETTNRRGEGQDEVTINYSSVGMRFDSWEVADGFNGTTMFFNPDMNPVNRANKYVKLEHSEYLELQYEKCYPWINISTMELEWWMDKTLYTTLKNSSKAGKIPAVIQQQLKQ